MLPQVLDFVEWTTRVPVDVRFIEFMPFSDTNDWNDSKFLSFKDTLHMIRQAYPDLHKLPTEPNHTSKGYSIPGAPGKVGFITSMSNNFCGTCVPAAHRPRCRHDRALTCVFAVCLFSTAATACALPQTAT